MKRKTIGIFFSKLRSDNIKAGMQRNIFKQMQGTVVNTGFSVQQSCEETKLKLSIPRFLKRVIIWNQSSFDSQLQIFSNSMFFSKITNHWEKLRVKQRYSANLIHKKVLLGIEKMDNWCP